VLEYVLALVTLAMHAWGWNGVEFEVIDTRDDPTLDPGVLAWASQGMTGNVCTVGIGPAWDGIPSVQWAGMLHEFGHCLDLDHVGDESSIMFPVVRPEGAITDDDFRRAFEARPVLPYWAIVPMVAQ
jgi:hypothetical protein